MIIDAYENIGGERQVHSWAAMSLLDASRHIYVRPRREV